MTLYDPLLEAEKMLEAPKKQKKIKIKISKSKILFTTKTPHIIAVFWKKISFIVSYLMLSGSIFAMIMLVMNFSAYSSRFIHWLQPDVYAQNSEEIANILTQSESSIDGENTNSHYTREIIEEKIIATNPEIVYSRSYSADALLANIPLHSAEKSSFAVNPYENRVIIPKLGKNIPFIQVEK